MSTKMEERIKKLLEENESKKINEMNERISGIFIYGMIMGIIMSYSGFLPYISGIGTGIFLSKKYKFITCQISDKISYIFQNMIKKINNYK